MRKLFLLLTLVCLSFAPQPVHPAAAVQAKVLMIGNSYTAGTHASFAAFAAADANTELVLGTATRGGWTTLDHFQNRLSPVYNGSTTSLEAMMTALDWDLVLIQEQSTRPSQAYLGNSVERDGFIKGMTRLDSFIKRLAPTAQIRYFQTWPRAQGNSYLQQYFQNAPAQMHNATATAYKLMANHTGAKEIHVGSAWTYSMAHAPQLMLHRADLSHPGPAGAYLSGAVFFAYAFGTSPIGSTYTGGLSTAKVDWLQAVADGTWQLLGP